MNKTNLILVLFLIFSILACKEIDVEPHEIKIYFPLDQPDLISRTDYKLISLILSNQEVSFPLTQMTNPSLYNSYEFIKEEISEFDSLVYVDFTINNSIGFHLDSVKIPEDNIKLISDAELDYLFNNPDFEYPSWENFYKWYPMAVGLHSMSRAGFNHDSTLAIVIHGFYQRFYESNIIYYCRKTNNKWEVIDQCGIETQTENETK